MTVGCGSVLIGDDLAGSAPEPVRGPRAGVESDVCVSHLAGVSWRHVALTNGDILQPSPQVVAVMIDGKPLEPASKHTRLYERYRERLKEIKEGRAPLGTR